MLRLRDYFPFLKGWPMFETNIMFLAPLEANLTIITPLVIIYWIILKKKSAPKNSKENKFLTYLDLFFWLFLSYSVFLYLFPIPYFIRLWLPITPFIFLFLAISMNVPTSCRLIKFDNQGVHINLRKHYNITWKTLIIIHLFLCICSIASFIQIYYMLRVWTLGDIKIL